MTFEVVAACIHVVDSTDINTHAPIWKERLKALASRKNKFHGARGWALWSGGHWKQVCWRGSPDSSDPCHWSRDDSLCPSPALTHKVTWGFPSFFCLHLSVSHSKTQYPHCNFASKLGAVIFQSEKRNKKFKIFTSFVFLLLFFLHRFFMCLLHCAPTILCNQMAQERRTKATKK